MVFENSSLSPAVRRAIPICAGSAWLSERACEWWDLVENHSSIVIVLLVGARFCAPGLIIFVPRGLYLPFSRLGYGSPGANYLLVYSWTIGPLHLTSIFKTRPKINIYCLHGKCLLSEYRLKSHCVPTRIQILPAQNIHVNQQIEKPKNQLESRFTDSVADNELEKRPCPWPGNRKEGKLSREARWHKPLVLSNQSIRLSGRHACVLCQWR